MFQGVELLSLPVGMDFHKSDYVSDNDRLSLILNYYNTDSGYPWFTARFFIAVDHSFVFSARNKAFVTGWEFLQPFVAKLHLYWSVDTKTGGGFHFSDAIPFPDLRIPEQEHVDRWGDFLNLVKARKIVEVSNVGK